MAKQNMINHFRSFIGLMLAVMTAWMVSSTPVWAAKTTQTTAYSPAQLEQIQAYAPRIQELSDRMEKLGTLVQKQNWVDVGTYIHGPLGELRRNLTVVANSLNPVDQKVAKDTIKDIANDLVRIGQSANVASYSQALKNYRTAMADFEKFLSLLPS